MAAMTDLRQPDVDEARRLLDTAEGQPLTREQVTVTASADGACIGKTLRALKRASTSAPTRGVKARAGWAVEFYLGMLTAPFMRAALVIHVDPERAQFPAFRTQQALVAATSQIGTNSSVWVVATRRLDALRELIRAVPLATASQPPGSP
jgi:hypothetical protein